MRLQHLYWLIDGSEFRHACSTVHRYADDIIKTALSQRDLDECLHDKPAFLSLSGGTGSDLIALRNQTINLLVAGRDTTACLISWSLYLLLRHPKAFKKLKEEIGTITKTAMSRYDLKHMKYLQNVLHKSELISFILISMPYSSNFLTALRLYPSVPVNSRTAIRDTILPVGGGPDLSHPVFVREGTTVAYSVYAMRRRPDLYGMDAELFRPERWDNISVSSWAYLPFNGGPQVCLGMDFGLVEAAYTIVRLLQRFPDMSLPHDTKLELVGVEKQTMTLVLSITEGCVVQLNGHK